jgi:hypothetical protein
VPEQPVLHPEADDTADVPPPPLCVRTAALAFQGGVQSELEVIFRRGPEFAQGYELVLLLQHTHQCGGSADNVAASTQQKQRDHFLSQLTALAQSSLAGAVQVSAGQVVPILGNNVAVRDAGRLAPPNDADLVTVFMARFPSEQQLAAFSRSPPVQALWQQGQMLQRAQAEGKAVKPQLPLAAVAIFVMRVNVDDVDEEEGEGAAQ